MTNSKNNPSRSFCAFLRQPQKNRLSRLAFSLIGLGLLSASMTAGAVSLGDVTYRSRLGEALKLEIPLKISAGEQLDASCISLGSAPTNDMSDIPWVSQAKLDIRQTEKGVVLSISARPAKHPALMLGVVIKCGISLRRDYALLLDPPIASESFAVQDAPAVIPRSESVPGNKHSSRSSNIPAQTWITGQGESLESVALVLYPTDPSARKRFIRKTLASARRTSGIHSPSDLLEPGTEIGILPNARPSTDKSIRRQERPADPIDERVSPAAEAKKAKTNTPGEKRDRILISEAGESALQLATTIGQRPEMSAQDRIRLRNELQLIAILDEKNAQHLELKERLKQLEALQARLKAEAASVENDLKAIQSPSAQTAIGSGASIASTSDTPIAVSAKKPVISPSANTTTSVAKRSPWYKTLLIPLLLLVLAAGILALILQQRKKKEALDLPLPVEPELPPAGATETASEPLPRDEDLLMEPLSPSDIWPETSSQNLSAKAIEGAVGPLSSLGASSILQTESEEEHNSAVELAEIMMSFGRIQGAAQTLSDFIRANPRQAVKPWLKLLEVYRVANMRMEFDALSIQLNKTFNVKPVPWDEFEIALRAPESIEDMSHIVPHLCALWGKREGQAYLHQLLRDNRQGTRAGFPLAIIDEILLLLSILEDQLGAYKPEAISDEENPLLAENVASQAPAPQNPTLTNRFTAKPLITPPILAPLIPETPLFEKSLSIMAQTPLGSESVLNSDLFLTEPLGLDLIDMDLLTKTLHINLDELTEPPQEEESPK